MAASVVCMSVTFWNAIKLLCDVIATLKAGSRPLANVLNVHPCVKCKPKWWTRNPEIFSFVAERRESRDSSKQSSLMIPRKGEKR